MKLALRRKPIELDADRYIEDDDSFVPVAPSDNGLRVRHLDGEAWYDVAGPRRWHRCWAQTIYDEFDMFGTVRTIERCACGAINMIDWRGDPRSIFDDRWMERNSR